MGYYTGNGVTSGGGESVNVIGEFWWWGAHYDIYQKHVKTVTRLPGVSLSTAQSKHGECNLQSKRIYNASGNISSWQSNCSGTVKEVSYSQIGASNLYEVVITEDQRQAKLADGGWS